MILGADVSKVVEEVGPELKDLAPGDEIYHAPEIFGPGSNGAYAEYSVASTGKAAKKPASLSHEEAAAIPLAGGIAYEVVMKRLKVRVGETRLVCRVLVNPLAGSQERIPENSSFLEAEFTRRRFIERKYLNLQHPILTLGINTYCV